MKIGLILEALLLATRAKPALASERGLRTPRSLDDEARELKNTKKPGVGSGSNSKNKGGGGGGNGGGPKRELSGRVIISRKSVKKLQAEGKGRSEIARLRKKAKERFAANGRKIVRQSGKEDDEGEFQVVEVGDGQEEAFMKELMSDPDVRDAVAYAEPDYTEFPVGTPNDPFLGNQYHHDLMQSALAWDLTTGSEQVTIGICDTGLQPNHPDLEDNRLEGYHAPTQKWESEGGLVTDVHPHGTMCAGCAAAIGNNGVGLAGVGWNFKHRPGRVTDSSGGGASSSALADCAMRMCEKSDVKVVSVSYSGVEGSTRRQAATYCKTQGALMVNAAGNDGRDLTQFGEADADDLIVAGASDNNDNKSGFSAYGAFVDVWAAGSAVWTTTTGSTYAPVSGTSFSCPLVAGLIALIWSKNPELTPNQVETILKQSTDNVGNLGQYNTMYGRINLLKAVQAAGSGTPFPTSQPTTPPPTSNPTNPPPGFAVHDGTTPRCNEVHSFCTSGNLLTSRANLSPTPESNSPNTIDGCADGSSGSYQSDESVEKIEVLSVGGGNLQVGQMAKVRATVWAWSSGGSDRADFYVTEGATNPVWTPITVGKSPGGGGERVIESDEFEITSTLQTVRVRFRYNGSANSCSNGSYDDADDLVFVAASSAPTSPAPTKEPTKVPTTPPPTKEPVDGPTTPPPTLLPTKEPTNVPTSIPTNNPTNNPTAQPTPLPTNQPTNNPTNNPTAQPTPLPTNQPTKVPTLNPTRAPTNKPTSNPTVSAQPSPFTPEEYVLSTPPTSSAHILRASYFEVEGSDVWTTITDLQVTTYGTNHLQVYSKLGEATPYEKVPCAWKLIAETASDWNGGSWKKVFPQWNSNGFDPVVLPAGQKVSFYVVNMGTSYGILGRYRSGAQLYSPWVTAPATSPVGAVVMTDGQRGYADQLFNAYTSNYAYGMYGGVKLVTMRPGSTHAPTTAPTSPYTPGALTSPIEPSTEEVNGLQFDVQNSGSKAIIVNKFDVRFASAGTHHVEVWMRDGSHKGSSGGCDAWNNWCGDWTKLTNSTVTSAGPNEFTSTPAIVGIIPPGVSSFAIISGKSRLLTKNATSTVSDGPLTLEAASPIKDYYASGVQTIKATDPITKLFQGIIHYDVAHSHCAVLSKASWVNAGIQMSSNGDDDEEEAEFVTQGRGGTEDIE